MNRPITVAAAQTGPVLSDDMRETVPVACAMIEEAGRKNVDIVSFAELFLTPFFPNTLTPDFDKYFVSLPSPIVQPIFDAAADCSVGLVFPFGEKDGRHYYNSCLVADKSGKQLGIYRKTHIPAIFPDQPAGRIGGATRNSISPRARSFRCSSSAAPRSGFKSATTGNIPKAAGCSRCAAPRSCSCRSARRPMARPSCATTPGRYRCRRAPMKTACSSLPSIGRAMSGARNHIGKSMIVSPIGAEMMAVASRDTPELLVQTIDLDQVRMAQTSLPWWRDRRPELYGELGLMGAAE
ncbi:MAG: nitrilase-related carbon-nitrogen hydrolase [Pseudomonadota bacterium]